MLSVNNAVVVIHFCFHHAKMYSKEDLVELSSIHTILNSQANTVPWCSNEQIVLRRNNYSETSIVCTLWDQLYSLSIIERFPLLRGSKCINTMAKCVFRSLKCVL